MFSTALKGIKKSESIVGVLFLSTDNPWAVGSCMLDDGPGDAFDCCIYALLCGWFIAKYKLDIAILLIQQRYFVFIPNCTYFFFNKLDIEMPLKCLHEHNTKTICKKYREITLTDKGSSENINILEK